MSEFSIQKQAPYYEQFYRMIKQMIFTGIYKPGQQISETQLAKEFHVSKSPIREAVRILENEGLVYVEKGKVVVYAPTIKDVKEIYFCRSALESFAVKQTTTIATDEELKKIETTLVETEEAIQAQADQDTIISLNEHFHQLIIKFTGNARLQKQVNDLKGLMHYFRILNFKGEHRAIAIVEQHKVIFDYMKKREAQHAAEEMIKHLECDTDHLVETLRAQENT
ncbi:GntR family transcriptional regulator [Salsuginibacillus kocurii]|uniref:GntR family transcriptional regulator n=1 Tax=Salsuginibacillus kocurii TaxID=427078 RepID=UPI00036DDFBE|nr:GntR family transcriptional regulator [Salsuginibacillus kocurii]